MMSVTLYGLKNCDTCKKVMKALEAAGRSVEFVDIRTEANLDVKVPEWIEAVGQKPLVNKRSTSWRALSGNQQKEVEKDRAEHVLKEHPTLIKRPVIEANGDVHIGWSKDVQSALL